MTGGVSVARSFMMMSFATAALLLGLQWQQGGSTPAAQVNSSNTLVALQDQGEAYCFLPAEAVSQTQSLLQGAIRGNREAQGRYQSVVRQHAENLRRCRSTSWLKNQAVWVRLYACDVQPGRLEALLDEIVSRGYNQVYVETFGGGQVLLPKSDNPTVWNTVVRSPAYGSRDLLAEAIAKGRERGLKVYSWLFALNFGYPYLQRSDRQGAIALNGRGENSLEARSNGEVGAVNAEEGFVDPYSAQARRDYATLMQAVARRRPDGILFDYVRYPRGSGSASVASRVQDLWIYGSASQQALLQRAQNDSGLELIRRYVSRGSITGQDLVDVSQLYPNDSQPLWQNRVPEPNWGLLSLEQQRSQLQWQLWQLTVAHARQGVLDFVAAAVPLAQQQRIPTGVVFFPDGNQTVGQDGYDSRLQPWESFSASFQWHPMSYATCGTPACIVAQVLRVLSFSPAGVEIMPVLAGTWGSSINGRPSLENQMKAIRAAAPQISSMSHFAFSWQNPGSDRDRQNCRLP